MYAKAIRDGASSSACLVAAIRNASTLVIADAAHGAIKPSFASCLAAASQLGGSVDALVCGFEAQEAAENIRKCYDVEKVLLADHAALEHHLAEPMASLVQRVMQRRGYNHCIMPASTTGKNVLPRAAALMRTQPVTDVISIESSTRFRRPIYAGNAIATVDRAARDGCPLMLTIRPTAFPPAQPRLDQGAPPGVDSIDPDEVNAIEAAAGSAGSEWVATAERSAERPDLGSARVVVSGGRALKSAEHFKLIEELADTLGGAVGASRAAVDAGMVPNDLQVGQTGKVVAPDLYIAVGISGAIQHVAGIKDSKVIVAINNDPEAPIFSVADVGIVGDLFSLVPELNLAVKER